MAMGGGLGSLAPYQQAVTQPTMGKSTGFPQPSTTAPTQGKGVPLNQTQPMPLSPARPSNPFAGQFSEQDKDNFLGFYDQNGPADIAPKNEFTPLTFGDQFTDFMNSPEYKRAVETDRSSLGQTADISRSDIFPDYTGSSSAIAPYEQAYRDYQARLNAPATPTQPGVQPRPGTPEYDYINALTMDPMNRRPQLPRYPFAQPQPFYGGLGGFLGGGYGFPMGPMYGGFRNRFGGFPMGMMPYQQPFYGQYPMQPQPMPYLQQPAMGKGFNPYSRVPFQPAAQPTFGKGASDGTIVPTQEEMTPLLDEFTDFYLNEFRPKYQTTTTASPYGSTLSDQNLFGIGRLLSGMG